ncbi:TetR/AcrR family transcriptional regulator [Microbacterium lushaniae]|uniref:TetR family transcriptional regulator n=1 Tax=Microbacterium lushaniae TaxID=2614639 RepID=A0A5J6L493_9MICO|nr:TetR/AcrR family transcriptional regulator [Microbacterium lushaniae]QEW03403.1 TetR family transcriptional regulator [Microbacterium lushaniae]
MPAEGRSGRPRASSREILAEAACELFLEQGYDATSVSDITTRAGVSRSSFFNYFATKGDVLWAALDERILALTRRLRDQPAGDADAEVRSAVAALADGFRPDSLALAAAQSEAMGIRDDLQREAGVRRARIAEAIAERLRREGVDALHADVVGAAYGGAVLAAIWRWAVRGPGRTELADVLAAALAVVPRADSLDQADGALA